jgi:hypothetical protein
MKSRKPRQSSNAAADAARLAPIYSPRQRDRHGRLIDMMQTWESGDSEYERDHAVMFGHAAVSAIVGHVFFNRNAQGAKRYPDVQIKVRSEMRTLLRNALEEAKKARTALMAADDVRFELHIAKAHLELEAARYPLRNAETPYKIAGKVAREANRTNAAKLRAKVTVEQVVEFAREKGYPGVKFEPFVAEAAEKFGVSDSTISRRLESAKKQNLLS